MTLQIYGAGRISRKRPTLVVGNKPNGKSRLAWDFYQFNKGLKSVIPGFGMVQEDDLIAMVSSYGAKPFWDYAEMNQSFSGEYKIRFFRNTISLQFGDVAAGPDNAVKDAVIAIIPASKRMVTPPPPKKPSSGFDGIKL